MLEESSSKSNPLRARRSAPDGEVGELTKIIHRRGAARLSSPKSEIAEKASYDIKLAALLRPENKVQAAQLTLINSAVFSASSDFGELSRAAPLR